MNEDIELLRQFSEVGSESAFRSLVQRYLNLVYFAALRRANGDAHLAQDITQQVFTTLAREASRLRNGVILAGWLYLTTKHAAASLMRTEQRRREREKAYVMQQNSGQEQAPSWDELRPHIDAAMDELSEHDRRAVLLRFFEERPFADIGRQLRVSEDAARMRVDRALGRLRDRLALRGISSTAAAVSAAILTQATQAAPAAVAAAIPEAALAAASAGSAVMSGAGLFQIMSTTKTIVGTSVTIVALSVGTALYEGARARRLEERVVALSGENTALRERQHRSDAELTAARAELQSSKKASVSGPTVNAGANPGDGKSTVSSSFYLTHQDPEYLELSVRLQRLKSRQKYAPLYARLGLDETQIQQFEDVLDEMQRLSMDVVVLTKKQGVRADDPKLQASLGPVMNSLEERLRRLLGEDRYAQFREYRRTASSRSSADLLASALYHTATPLTLAQADLLTASVAAHTKSGTPDASGVSLRGGVDWEKVTAEMKDSLSREQLAALNHMAESDRLQKQLFEVSRRITDAALASSKGTPAQNGQ